MNITFEVHSKSRKAPELITGTFAPVPPAMLALFRGMAVTDLDAVRLFAENIAKAALASSDRMFSSVDLVLSSGN